MATLPFLDTNVLLRHLRQDHPDHSPRATAYLDRVERGEQRVRITETVVFETVFTLESFYRQPRPAIRESLLPLIDLVGILLPGKRLIGRAFDLYVSTRFSFADAYHAAFTERLRSRQIVSFDRGFDRVPGLQRIEP